MKRFEEGKVMKEKKKKRKTHNAQNSADSGAEKRKRGPWGGGGLDNRHR